MPPLSPLRLAAFLATYTLLAVTVVAAAPKLVEQTYADDFTPTEARPAGRPLPAIAADLDGPVWHIDGSVVLTAKGAITSASGGAAWFPLDPGADSLHVKAGLQPAGSDWTALAIGGRWGASFYNTAQLWVLLRPSSDYQVRVNGEKIILKSGKTPRYSGSGPNVVELRYRKSDRTVTVVINGQTVLDNQPLPAGDFTPALDSAGVKINGPIDSPHSPAIDDFALTFDAPLTPHCEIALDEPLAIYAPGAVVEARVNARGLPAGSVRLESRIETFDGRALGHRQITLPVTKTRLSAPLPLPRLGELGHFVIVCELTDANGASIGRFTRPFAIVPEPPAATRAAGNPFGAMVYPHLEYSFEDKERDAVLMRRIGLSWVRTARLNWLRAQASAEAPFRWTDIDREVGLYAAHDIRIVATAGWPVPVWASQARDLQLPENKGNFMPTPEGMNHARRFYRELATRHRGRIHAYEIGNEVDAYFWLGSAESFRNHDVQGVMRDYFEYYTALSGEILAADPDALVGPATTSLAEGHAYQPWLTTMLKLGIADRMTAYFPHYHIDLDYVNAKFREHGGLKPVLVTEVGGFARTPDAADPRSRHMRLNIRGDYLQMVGHLAHPNVRALCKFIFREQPTYGGEGTIVAGLLGADFSVRASYPAYATLVRHLADAKFVKDLNITRSASAGWVRGFAFERDGQRINVLFLNGGGDAQITLSSPAATLGVVDVMGNLTALPVRGGQARLTMSPELPLIVLGPLDEAAGTIDIPTDKLVDEVVFDLANPDFEQPAPAGRLPPGWSLNGDSPAANAADDPDRFRALIDTDIAHAGTCSARMEARRPTAWYGLRQTLPMKQLPRPGPGEYLVFKVSCFAKGEEIHGKGFGYTLTFRRANGERLQFAGSPYFGFGGTYDWKELSGKARIEILPEGTERIDLDLQLGKSTGTVWIDDVHAGVELWRRP